MPNIKPFVSHCSLLIPVISFYDIESQCLHILYSHPLQCDLESQASVPCYKVLVLYRMGEVGVAAPHEMLYIFVEGVCILFKIPVSGRLMLCFNMHSPQLYFLVLKGQELCK